jgi:AcrR family transcriptional regulator
LGGEMSDTRRRAGTREKIQEIALELFAEQGYEKTSLREIAERLGVTKAALYYHFPTKDDIVAGLFDDFLAQVDEIIDWARDKPVDDDLRRQIVRRYSDVITSATASALMQFIQGNQSAIRDLKHSDDLFARFRTLSRLLTDPTAALTTQLKSGMALGMLHIGVFGPIEIDATPQQRQAAALEVALELISGPGASRPE